MQFFGLVFSVGPPENISADALDWLALLFSCLLNQLRIATPTRFVDIELNYMDITNLQTPFLPFCKTSKRHCLMIAQQ